MPQSVGTVTSTLRLDTRQAAAAYKKFEQQVARSSRRDNFMSGISADAKDFENSLGKATNRVVAFGAAAAVFTTLAKAASAFAESIIEVDNSLAKINVNLNQSGADLKKFGADLFNVARQTGQTFEVAAKAAEELARQGLGAGETIERLQKALILSRIAGIDSTTAVETLTAAINSFNEEALTASEVVNKFAAVDTKFAVSSKDLAEAVSRVGSTAQSAGVGINELIGLVTSLQQTTARGGATIGNGLKTIFTRIQAAPETVAALEGVGVAIKNTDGSLRDAISILRDYAIARERVGETERTALDRTVAGTFQINILKAALGDLSKEYSVYGSAVRTASGATDEAIQKNAKLNETLASLINSTSVSIKQFFASVGSQDLGPTIQGALKLFEKMRAFFSGDSGSDLGKTLGEGILKGLSSVISGPVLGALLIILANAFKKVIGTILVEARTLLSINSAAQTRANIQKQINILLQSATDSERAQYVAASSVLAKKEQILAIQARINQESLAGTPIARSFQIGGGIDPRIGRGSKYLGIPRFADPIGAAISREKAAGVPAHQIYVDRDARVASFANPMGLLVANRRDEPLGGFQGVNRVLSQGGNPKTNGIPGFAKPPENADLSRLLTKLNSGGSLRRKEIDSIESIYRQQIISQKLGGFSHVSDQILAQNKDLAEEINASTSLMVKKIYEQNTKNIANKLKAAATKKIGPILSGRENVVFGDVEGDLKEVEKSLGRKLRGVEKRVFGEYAARISENRRLAIGAADQRSASFDTSFGLSREGFRQNQKEMAKKRAFENLKTRYLEGGSLTNAQFGFLNKTFRNEAGELAKQRIAPGSKAGVTEAFIAFQAQQSFGQLNQQRLKNQQSNFYPSPAGPTPPPDLPKNGAAAGTVEAAREKVIYLANLRKRMALIKAATASKGIQLEEQKLADIEQKSTRRANRTIGAGFGAALLGGFAEPTIRGLGFQTGGGTPGGILSGIISAGSFAGGTAAQLSGGNPYVAGGAAVVGALIGAFSKLKKSSEELGEELEKASSQRADEADAISRILALREQIKDAQKEGLSPAVTRSLNNQLLQATTKVASRRGLAVLNSSTQDQQDHGLENLRLESATKEAAKNVVDILAGRSTGKISSAFKGGLNKDIIGSLTPGKLAAINAAGSSNFDATRVIYEGAESNQNFERVKAGFIDAAGGLLDGVEVTRDNIKLLARELVTSVLGFKKIIADSARNSGTPYRGLGKGAYLDRLNTDVFNQAAFLGRIPAERSTRNQRARSQFDLFQELFKSGAVKEETLTGRALGTYNKSKASIQNENLLEGISKFVRQALPGVDGITDPKGDAYAPGLRTALKGLAKRKGDTGVDARFLLGELDKGQNTLTNFGVVTPPIGSGYNLPRDKYSTYVGTGKSNLSRKGYTETDLFGKPISSGGYLPSIAAGRATGPIGVDGLSTLREGLPYLSPFASVEERMAASKAAKGSPSTVKDRPLIKRVPNRFDTGGSVNIVSNVGDTSDDNAIERKAPGAGRNSSIDEDAIFGKTVDTANQDLVKAVQAAAQTTLEALRQTLKIAVTIDGADPTTIEALRASIQELYNSRAADRGMPNPPSFSTVSVSPAVSLSNKTAAR